MSQNNSPVIQGTTSSSPVSTTSQELRIPVLSPNIPPSPDISIGLPSASLGAGTLTPTSTLDRRSSSNLGDGTLRRMRVASIIPSPLPSLNDEATLRFDDQENSDGASHFSSSDSEGDGGAPQRNSDRHRSVKLAKKEQKRRILIRNKTHDSFRLTTNISHSESPWTNQDYVEPKIHPKVRKRAKQAIRSVAQLVDNEEEEEERKGCCSRLCSSWRQKSTQEVENVEEQTEELLNLTPEMEKANDQGWDMIKKVLFPSIPAVLQDLWVYLELLITIAAFAFAVLDLYPIADNFGFNYAYLGLIVLSMILALLDAWVYFFQLGSCARGIRVFRNFLKKRRKAASMIVEEGREVEDGDDETESEPRRRKCCQFSPKWKQYFNTFFELIRNLASELILYPLLVFDLFDFILDEVFRPQDGIARADFGLFVVGSFYLILAVYIMRIFVVGGSMLSLIRLPKNAKETGNSSDNSLLIKFCLHIIGQILVHFTTIVVIGAKINNENLPSDDDLFNNATLFTNGTEFMNSSNGTTEMGEEGGANASPFLIVAIVLGGLLPITGIVMFFIVNIYWMREFSIGFWLNMISLLQGESFAETVFGGQGKTVTKDKALKFVQKSQYKKVKKDLKRFKSPSKFTKFLYPTRIPLAALSGLLYDILIIVFILCLALTYKDHTVSVAVFKDDPILTYCFMISLVSTIVANIHVLILLNILLLIFLSTIALAALIVLFWSPFLLIIYFPVVGILGYILLFREIGCATKKRSVKNKAAFVNGTNNGGSVKRIDESLVVISNHSDLLEGQDGTSSKKDSLDKEEIEMLEAYQNRSGIDTAST